MHVMLVVPILPEECQPDQPEHVKRCQYSGQQPHCVQRFTAILGIKRRKQNCVLREKRRKGKEPRDRDRPEQHAPERDLNLGIQPAHVPHVLFAAHRVYHAPGRKEQQRLEERVRHQVENPRAERPYAASQEHVAKLAHR